MNLIVKATVLTTNGDYCNVFTEDGLNLDSCQKTKDITVFKGDNVLVIVDKFNNCFIIGVLR
ncbi:hypothetical protein [Methanobrevibacter curvatus]|uniref:Uncharacterized protein n=1 Tax=Methanobrevibacter curvatus TaxID=49547 RepID=A0A166CAZ6_9EURY|nr:hypothetical protein [Methanobrevibacter curvatus]KZX14316.1 hypothetical protein MBCUR_05400 [Methanobrevibacter curvatus]